MLRRILPTFLDTKYFAILDQERSLARAIAAEVILPNPITVWEVMIPIIFLFSILKFKRAREVFVLNFLFTKKLALEAAYNMVAKGREREDEMAVIEAKTDQLLASVKKIYSSKIRKRQLKEIDLLIDHYLKLLEAEGKDYPSLVRNAYETKENYLNFLEQLKQAEKEVNKAALQTVEDSDETAYELTSKMEEAAERIRLEQAEKIFPPE